MSAKTHLTYMLWYCFVFLAGLFVARFPLALIICWTCLVILTGVALVSYRRREDGR